MTKIKFFAKNLGFEILGHSSANENDEGGKIVCAAVSSAAYMAANTIIEIVKDNVQTEISEAKMLIKILNPSEKTKHCPDRYQHAFKKWTGSHEHHYSRIP